jgi:hypothetical protein
MLKHIATQTLTQPLTVAICDECANVTDLKKVFDEEGKPSYCCARCADKFNKGFLFGIEPQKAVQHAYED